MDFAQARRAMVESQVRPADVTAPGLIAAMRRIPREAFFPPAQRALSYGDLELEAAPGRALLRPRDLGKLLQALAPRPADRALEIAGATAYGAAVLAACVREVVTLDPSPELSFAATNALKEAGAANVVAVSTDPLAGWPDGAPYDVIMLNGAADFVPQAWLDQLAEGGRLGVIVRAGAAGHARVYVKEGGKTGFHVAFDAFPPLAPKLAQAPAFTF